MKFFMLSPHGIGPDGRATLTMFLWRNGAPFDTIMNRHSSAAFQAGIDPRNPTILRATNAFNNSMNDVNGTLPGRIEQGHPVSLGTL